MTTQTTETRIQQMTNAVDEIRRAASALRDALSASESADKRASDALARSEAAANAARMMLVGFSGEDDLQSMVEAVNAINLSVSEARAAKSRAVEAVRMDQDALASMLAAEKIATRVYVSFFNANR